MIEQMIKKRCCVFEKRPIYFPFTVPNVLFHSRYAMISDGATLARTERNARSKSDMLMERTWLFDAFKMSTKSRIGPMEASEHKTLMSAPE